MNVTVIFCLTITIKYCSQFHLPPTLKRPPAPRSRRSPDSSSPPPPLSASFCSFPLIAMILHCPAVNIQSPSATIWASLSVISSLSSFILTSSCSSSYPYCSLFPPDGSLPPSRSQSQPELRHKWLQYYFQNIQRMLTLNND